MKIKKKSKICKFILNKKKICIIFFLHFLIELEKNLKYFIKIKVSVFLPIYNKDIYLERSINSIQKQTLKFLEIIAVNDFSTDNSLKILKKFNKKDNRIKIFNNDRNYGLLYSRAMGILNSSGEYVLDLDPDDMFSNKYNLEILYKNAKKHNTDLIIFKLKKIRTNKIKIPQINIFIRKININISTTQKKNDNKLITNKFIKRKIILKAYMLFKNKIFGNKWNYHEDNIWCILINKYSKSKILLNKYIYLYLLNCESLMNHRGNILELTNRIYKYEMIQIIYKNNFFVLLKNFFYLINKYKFIITKNLLIKKKIIRIFIDFLINYKNKNLSIIINIINKISNNEFINIFNISSKKIFNKN